MSYATILTIVSGLDEDALAIRTAIDLVDKTHGEVRVLLATSASNRDAMAVSEGVYMTSALLDDIEHGIASERERTEALIQKLSSHSDRAGETSRPRIMQLATQSTADLQLDSEAALCDLVVVSLPTVTSQGGWASIISAALMHSRLPCLIVQREMAFQSTVAIAWDGGSAAGRAVRAALPLLRAASKVIILQDPAGLRHSNADAATPGRLRAYLQGHGVRTVETVSERGLSRRDGLMEVAQIRGAALLVAGAFSHSRLREQLVGGVTRELMKSEESINLLLSH